ncbi:hypothetical protein CYMTET_56233 [Cymbomonas tetramitiformis]|uniref:Fe2OG dioxygenase domain-containing protein n=1 Tax=Cymbomonas tetramitiformis TaxID=36881 RepID=A0AAE0BBC5_9CHLO|nr:hypothetical protein CYMTET_56233 [Cymbomonas tetramitiformis]|eukprot:gene520-914_t
MANTDAAMMTEGPVPIIDIKPFLTFEESNPAAQAVIQAWDKAFSTVGFAVIVGHGVPEEVVVDTYAKANDFFSLPMEDKMKSCLGKGYGVGGYLPPGLESVGSSKKGAPRKPSDIVENILVHYRESDVIPERPAGYKDSVYRYWEAVNKLLLQIMELSAVALGLPRSHFNESFASPSNVLRLAHYPDEKNPKPGQLRYGEHTDYTGFTILKVDQVPGLQVKLQDGSWADIPYIPGSFIVNAGDLLQVWTNDRWLSNLHRVQIPPCDLDGNTERTSIVFFTGPHNDTLVSCLPTCLAEGDRPHYEPIKAGEHLWQRINASNVT